MEEINNSLITFDEDNDVVQIITYASGKVKKIKYRRYQLEEVTIYENE